MTTALSREGASKLRRAQRQRDAITAAPWFRGLVAAQQENEQQGHQGQANAPSGDEEDGEPR